MESINWKARLIGIRGARGVGKTTLLLQYIKDRLPADGTSLYVSLDNIWFTENRLTSLADMFTKRGGRYLFLDEVHKYPGWAQEIKNLYDDYPELKIVFTGSSLLDILNARADLSRRAVVYNMQGLSFREFLAMTTGNKLPVFPLNKILTDHLKLSKEVLKHVRPLKYFDQYLRYGYYPFYRELPVLYHQRIEETLNMILEIELPSMRGVDTGHLSKIKQLLQIISESVPFMPNISKLSERTGINRVTLLSYLWYLQEARVIISIYKEAQGITKLQKPDKLYMENTNILFALAPGNVNKGNLRETFIVNQLSYGHKVEYPLFGDLLVDNKYIIETGGKKKSGDQITGIPDSFIAADDIEYGNQNRIPLWLFGFTY